MEVVRLSVQDLKPHPRNESIFGAASSAVQAQVVASIVENGILDPLDIIPFDAEDNAGCVVDGNMRLGIVRELGWTEVPARIRAELRTLPDQILFAVEKAKRKQYTQSQRAHQEEEARKAIVGAPPGWRRAGERERDVVARMTGQAPRTIDRRQRVFFGPTTTPELQSAVDADEVSLGAAERLIQESERRHRPGSTKARQSLNESVERARRRERGPRLPILDKNEPKREQANFWRDIERQIREWAVAQDARLSSLGEAALRFAISECASDVKCAVLEMRRKIERRLSDLKTLASPTDRASEINRCLAVLGLASVGQREVVDRDLVKRAHKRLARELHPDFNASDARAPEKFHAMQSAYDRLLNLLDDNRAASA